MVDSTPPTSGQVTVDFYNFNKLEEDIIIHWSGFEDKESGLLGFELAVGSHAYSQDVLPFEPVSGQLAVINGAQYMENGKRYFFQIKVM